MFYDLWINWKTISWKQDLLLWMSLIIALITDFSGFVVWHFLMSVFESSIIVAKIKPIEIPNLMACKPAYASAASGDETFLWMTVFEVENSPIWSRITRPEVDLEFLLSKAALNCIGTLVISSFWLWILSIFKWEHSKWATLWSGAIVKTQSSTDAKRSTYGSWLTSGEPFIWWFTWTTSISLWRVTDGSTKDVARLWTTNTRSRPRQYWKIDD